MNYFGFRMNYKKYQKRVLSRYISVTIAAIILILLTFYFHKSIRSTRPFKDIVIFYVSYILTFTSRAIMSMKYSFILISLSTRYGQLNALLWNQSSLDLHSNRTDQKLLIKRIGKFYDNLSEIMDTINFTHSFQVCSFSPFSDFWNKSDFHDISFHFQHPDYVEYGRIFCVFPFDILFDLPKHNVAKLDLSWGCIDSLELGDFYFNEIYSEYLLCNFTHSWGKFYIFL